MRRPELTIKQVLAWADAYHDRTRKWPDLNSGRVWEPADEKWANIDQALRIGLRGLRGGQSLAKLLAKHRGKRNRKQLPKYTLKQILAWADAHHARTGTWPRHKDGLIPGTRGETWLAVDMALNHGQRGLPGGTSLARVLAARRGAGHRLLRPRLTVRQILHWADLHYQRSGNWPTDENGPIAELPGDTWRTVIKALREGRRGLRRTSWLQLLSKHRGAARHVRRPALTIDQVLAWADEHHQRTGQWPNLKSGRIAAAAGRESWESVNNALVQGKRDLPAGKSLAVLLAEKRGVRTRVALQPLTEKLILRWARAYQRKHGRWPNRNSGPIDESGGETWSGVRTALDHGLRGLKRGTTLTELIKKFGKPKSV